MAPTKSIHITRHHSVPARAQVRHRMRSHLSPSYAAPHTPVWYPLQVSPALYAHLPLSLALRTPSPLPILFPLHLHPRSFLPTSNNLGTWPESAWRTRPTRSHSLRCVLLDRRRMTYIHIISGRCGRPARDWCARRRRERGRGWKVRGFMSRKWWGGIRGKISSHGYVWRRRRWVRKEMGACGFQSGKDPVYSTTCTFRALHSR